MSKAASKDKPRFAPVIIQKNKELFIAYVFFLIVYVAFSLIPPPPAITLHRYHLSVLGLRLISVTIIILLALIWAAGFYGFAKLRAYSKTIEKQKDGPPITNISRGIFLLVMWLPVSEVVSVVLKYIATQNPGFIAASTIIDNYLNLIIPLAGFIVMGIGARGLSSMIRSRHNFAVTNLMYLLLAFGSVIYTHLVLGISGRAQIYHMSLWLVLLTIVAPYVYMWFIGSAAAYEIYNYQHKVSGVLYRRSWRMLAIGCGWLIISSMVFQYLTTLTPRLSQFSIYGLLAIIYSLLAVLSIGFIFIALGAARLQKLEEI